MKRSFTFFPQPPRRYPFFKDIRLNLPLTTQFSMAAITLTSDYGLVDYTVAAVKGSILNLKNECGIIDISHEIRAYDLAQTAYVVRNAYKFFPQGTIHIICVDSFYSKHIRAVLYKADGHYFIAADNGVLSLVFFDQVPEAVYEITLNNRFDDKDKVNFTVTDIFVPAAVHLSNGGLPEIIGRPISDPKELTFRKAVHKDKMIIGEIIYIDNFGNLVTNISRNFFEKHRGLAESFIIKFRNLGISNVFDQYSDIVTDTELESQFHGQPAAVFNAVGLLELSIYKGNKDNGAKTLFGMKLGEKVIVEFS